MNGNPIKKAGSAAFLGEQLKRCIVPLLFTALSVAGFYFSGMRLDFFVNDLISRLGRNSFLVISLIIPVLAGMGLNFGIVLGAMAGQFGALFAIFWEIEGLAGFAIACAIAVPFSLLFGYLTGAFFNRTKGKEMIAGLILSFFANGVYLLICLVLVGTAIPVSPDNAHLLLPEGVGIVNTVDLWSWQYAVDKIWIIRLNVGSFLESVGLGASITTLKTVIIPVATLAITGLLCVAVWLLFRTKLGQDIRAVGQNRHIAEVAGINVDKTRIIAILFSTVLAAWGQLFFLQNIGTLQTYGSHVQVGTFAVAALLVGSASVNRATVWQALVGILLFHALFIVSPQAGKNLLNSAQIGEFFRVFVAYGVIGVALALHAWQRKK